MPKRLFLALLLLPRLAAAQEAPPRTALKVHLLSPLLHAVSVGIERKFSPGTAGQVSVYLMDSKFFRGFGITPEARFHPTPTDGLTGLYLGPYGRYHNGNVRVTDEHGNGTYYVGTSALSVGAVVGYEFTPLRHLAIDLTLRAGFFLGTIVSDGRKTEIDFSAVDGRELLPGVAAGWAF